MSRKRTHRKPHTGLHPLDLMRATQPMPADRVQTIMVKIHDAFDCMRAGTADQDLFDRLAIVLNVGLVRSEQIGPAGVEVFRAAQEGLRESAEIAGRHGRYGFSGPGLEALRQAVALYEEILAASSPLQMARAQDEVMRRFRRKQVACTQALAVRALCG